MDWGVSLWQVLTLGIARGAVGHEFTSVSEADVKVRDMLNVTPCVCWRHGFHSWWLPGAGDVAGRMTDTGRGFVQWEPDGAASSLPVSVLLENLGSLGWRAGREHTSQHTPDEHEKLLDVSRCWSTPFV